MSIPFSLDAERGLVARLLMDPSQMAGVTLDADDLHDPDARAAFEAMQSLSERGEPIDIVTLREEADREIDIHLPALTAAHHAPLDSYAQVIRRDSWRRRLISRLDKMARLAQVESEPHEILSDLQGMVALCEEEADLLMADKAGQFGALDLEHYRQAPLPPLLGVLSPEGTTILYGDGGDGKGWVAARWAASLGVKVGILDFEAHAGEWAYRFDRFGLDLDQVVYVSPSMTMDRWATEQTARYLRNEGVQYLVIDSAMYASDSDDPYSPGGALAYGRARRRLNNLPALLLAHTTGNQDKVFGSVFWRNESRLVWRLDKDRLTRQRRLECRKANNYPQLEGKRLEIEFNEERGILNLHEHGKPWVPESEDF